MDAKGIPHYFASVISQRITTCDFIEVVACLGITERKTGKRTVEAK
jgi:hypothetical protein